MSLITKRITRILPLTIPFLLILSLVLLIQSTYFSESADLLANAVTIDILLIVPLVYFLIICKRDIPKFTVLSMFVLGLVILSYTLPKENQQLLDLIKTYFLPILELSRAFIAIANPFPTSPKTFSFGTPCHMLCVYIRYTRQAYEDH